MSFAGNGAGAVKTRHTILDSQSSAACPRPVAAEEPGAGEGSSSRPESVGDDAPAPGLV